MTFNPTYKPFGERAILIEWPPKIDETILKDIIQYKRIIEKNHIEAILELKSAYHSLLIVYKFGFKNFEKEVVELKNLYHSKRLKQHSKTTLWKVPVCYDLIFGIDLEAISVEKEMSIADLVSRHSQTIYTVYFIGFLPGFLYLGGLDEALQVPRKSDPRLKIEKGAVAIGGHQTGIYPMESPGGWNIIGNAPIEFFNPNSSSPCFAQAGDKIRFAPISMDEYKAIKMLSDAAVYQVESEVIND